MSPIGFQSEWSVRIYCEFVNYGLGLNLTYIIARLADRCTRFCMAPPEIDLSIWLH